MTGGTTTIEITEEQREELREINDGSAKAALAAVLEAYNTEDTSVDEEEVARLVVEDLQASLPTAVADEVVRELQ